MKCWKVWQSDRRPEKAKSFKICFQTLDFILRLQIFSLFEGSIALVKTLKIHFNKYLLQIKLSQILFGAC